jgi:hypothetical protein
MKKCNIAFFEENNFLAVTFFLIQFLVIKTLDLDPDPDPH